MGRIVGHGRQLSEQYGIPLVGTQVGVSNIPIVAVGVRLGVLVGVPGSGVRVSLGLPTGFSVGTGVSTGAGALLPPPQPVDASPSETARPITAASLRLRVIRTRMHRSPRATPRRAPSASWNLRSRKTSPPRSAISRHRFQAWRKREYYPPTLNASNFSRN